MDQKYILNTSQYTPMQYDTSEYSTIQHNTKQAIRYAMLPYNTAHTDKHAVHYVNFVSFPCLRLLALHFIIPHYTALPCATVPCIAMM